MEPHIILETLTFQTLWNPSIILETAEFTVSEGNGAPGRGCSKDPRLAEAGTLPEYQERQCHWERVCMSWE